MDDRRTSGTDRLIHAYYKWFQPSNTSIKFGGNGGFIGAIYAPQAILTLSGGGSTDLHFSGACVTRSITINGHYKFHYDEALGATGPESLYVITSWVEL